MPTPTQRCRIAVAGAGVIGREHARRIVAAPTLELAAIVDPSPAGQAFAESLPARHFRELGECLRDASIDGVIVATPNQCHVENGLQAVRARVPLLVEKPISDDLASAWRLVEAAEAARVPILVGHHRRHSPAIQEAKRIVGAGRLGQLLTVSGFCLFRKPAAYFEGSNAWRTEAGGGVVLINLVHVIDDLRNLMGEIVAVQAAGSNAARGFAVDDTVVALLHFANGALGTLTISDATSAPWSWEMTSGENPAFPKTDESCYLIAGTQGSLTVPTLDVWKHQGEGWMTPIGKERIPVAAGDPLTRQLAHFEAVIRGEEVPVMDGRGGARTLEVTLAIQRAAASGELIRFS